MYISSQTDQLDPHLAAMSEYHLAKQLRVSDAVPASAGGLNKTSNIPIPTIQHSSASSFSNTSHPDWDLEIRKRYAQPLASETGEFPDADTIQSRMLPICYEESLVNGCTPACAGFMATATEHFIKEVLSSIYTRTRSNMPSGSVNSIMTNRFKKQLRREEEAVKRGEIVRGLGSGLLPVEVKEAASRKPVGMHDLRLALEVGDCGLGQFPFTLGKVMNGYQEGELEEYAVKRKRDWEAERKEAELKKTREEKLKAEKLRELHNMVNGVNGINSIVTNGIHEDEPMDDDDEDWGWEGGRAADRLQLNSLLDECLAFGQ